MRLKAGMLYYTLFLMVLSAVIISLLLLRGSLFFKVFIVSQEKEKLNLDITSAFNVYKEGVDLFIASDSCSVDLFDDNSSVVNATRERWGIFDIVKISETWKNQTFSKEGLFGSDLERGENVALYLADEDADLSVSGSSFLNGVCYVPDGIIKMASIDGKPFIYKKPSSGVIKTGNKRIPDINGEIIKSILSGFKNVDTERSIETLKLYDNHIITNSFSSQTLTFFANESVRIENYCLKGNVVVASTGTISIAQTANLQDVIVLARKIILEKGFSGSLQAFALDTIIVEPESHLHYPSVLSIVQDTEKRINDFNMSISIGDNSIIEGSLFIYSKDNDGSIRISPGSKVIGQLYCTGSVYLKGDVYGSLYCNRFIYNSSRTTYINHILDSDIDFSRLPKRFSGFSLEAGNNKKNLIKWLD